MVVSWTDAGNTLGVCLFTSASSTHLFLGEAVLAFAWGFNFGVLSCIVIVCVFIWLQSYVPPYLPTTRQDDQS